METKLTPLAATAFVLAVLFLGLYLAISVDGGAEDDVLFAASGPAVEGAASKVDEGPALLSPPKGGVAEREDVARPAPTASPFGILRGRLHREERTAGGSIQVVLQSWNGVDRGRPEAPVATRVEHADGEGRFLFAGLSPGVYGLVIELQGRHLLSYGQVELGRGETLDLGELRIDANRGWAAPRPEPIRFDRNGDRVSGTGAEERLAVGGGGRAWAPKGKLNVCPPYHPYLVSGQALQYILESPVLSPDTMLSATEIGGMQPPNNASVTHTVTGCIFHGLIPGEYSVKVTLLLKNAQGRWLPTGLRSKGTAKVVGGETIACEWSRD